MLVRIINGLCKRVGVNTPEESQQLIDGLRRDLDAAVGALHQAAKVGNQTAKIVEQHNGMLNGVLLTHQAYEQASKPLMQAKRKLHRRLERKRKKEAELAALAPASVVESLSAEGRAEYERTGELPVNVLANPGGDATASDDEAPE